MKLALGTAQFGFKYGIANVGGPVPSEQAVEILTEARQAGFDTLDTAIAYGDSEERLGKLGVQDWNLVSKLPALPNSIEDVVGWVRQHVRGSLERLGVQCLDGLLMHRPSDILGPHGTKYARALRELRDDGLVKAIGYAIYSPDDLKLLCAVLAPNIVQAPYNLIDRRLATTGWMDRLTENGVRIHTRSAFLQGLLLMPANSRPPWFRRWDALWETWSKSCLQSRLSPLELSLGFVLAQSKIERVVVGVDNSAHLHQVIAVARKPIAKEFPEIESKDLDLIDPSRWKIQ